MTASDEKFNCFFSRVVLRTYQHHGTFITVNKLLFCFEQFISCFRYSCLLFLNSHYPCRRSQCPHGLRRRSADALLLRLWVRIPPGTWMFVCCACCVLPGRGLCDELITRPEESYRLWCVVVCDLETSWMRRPWPTGGCRAKNKQIILVSLSSAIRNICLCQFRWLLFSYARGGINREIL